MKFICSVLVGRKRLKLDAFFPTHLHIGADPTVGVFSSLADGLARGMFGHWNWRIAD